jgi:hypothetical protein
LGIEGIRRIAERPGVLDLFTRLRARAATQRPVQLEIAANLYALAQPILLPPFTRFMRRSASDGSQTHTHAVEILLTLTNRGRRRFRLFNAQLGVNTLLRPRLDSDDGHLHLNRIFTSGNIVPGQCDPEAGAEPFYAVEPGVAQTIHFLALIPAPHELLQVVANVGLQRRRASVETMKRGLYPFSAVRTFQLGSSGGLASAP